MNKTMWAIIIVIVVAAAGWYFLSGHANETVATVNGTPITRSQLTASELQIALQQGLTATSTAVQAQFQPDALNLLIGQTLIEQASTEGGHHGVIDRGGRTAHRYQGPVQRPG